MQLTRNFKIGPDLYIQIHKDKKIGEVYPRLSVDPEHIAQPYVILRLQLKHKGFLFHRQGLYFLYIIENLRRKRRKFSMKFFLSTI